MINKEWHKEALSLRDKGFSGRAVANIIGKSKSQVNNFFKFIFPDTEEQTVEKKGPRVLVLDIETKYMTLQGFGLFNQNFYVDQIE